MPIICLIVLLVIKILIVVLYEVESRWTNDVTSWIQFLARDFLDNGYHYYTFLCDVIGAYISTLLRCS